MLFLLIHKSKGKDDEDEDEFDADLGVIDQGPTGGVLGVEGVADCDKAEARDEGKGCGVGNAGGDCGAGSEKRDEYSGHTYKMKK